jgi:hypothetical protein
MLGRKAACEKTNGEWENEETEEAEATIKGKCKKNSAVE